MLSTKEALLKTVVKDHWVVVRYQTFASEKKCVDFSGNPEHTHNIRYYNHIVLRNPVVVFHGTLEQCSNKMSEYMSRNKWGRKRSLGKYSYSAHSYEKYRQEFHGWD